MTVRIGHDDGITQGDAYKQQCFAVTAKIFEAVYPNDDMGFEQLQHLGELYVKIAEYEIKGGKNEDIIRRALERAAECCEKTASVKKHVLTHPLLYGTRVEAAPNDNAESFKFGKTELAKSIYDDFRSREWFQMLEKRKNDV